MRRMAPGAPPVRDLHAADFAVAIGHKHVVADAQWNRQDRSIRACYRAGPSSASVVATQLAKRRLRVDFADAEADLVADKDARHPAGGRRFRSPDPRAGLQIERIRE